MNTISLLNLRSRLGETIDEIRRLDEPLIVLKNNRPVAIISPYHEAVEQPSREEIRQEVVRYSLSLAPDLQLNEQDESPLYDLAGWGEHVSLEDEKDKIAQRMEEKHGR